MRKNRPTERNVSVCRVICDFNLQQIKAYAVIVGTAAALMRELKATGEGRIVQRSKAATTNMTVTALRGSLCFDTAEIQPENGSTPSLATAQINLELATPATVTF